MKNFAIIGVGGYIAPRHIEAINATGNRLVCAFDPNDSVGILDRYTQDVEFFTDFESFEAHFESLKGTDQQIDYVSICSPNYLHSPHIKFAMRQNCNVICEKPLVLSTKDIDELKTYETKYGKSVKSILQLRDHESIKTLKQKIENSKNQKFEIDLTYITSRGPWYHKSWKGDVKKSGGLMSNIGIHFFDMLSWIFGGVLKNELHSSNDLMASGYLELEKANVKWLLSVNKNMLPEQAVKSGKTTFRSITVDGEELEFSQGFTDLHMEAYTQILSGKGYGLDEAVNAIKIVEDLRSQSPLGVTDHSHSILRSN